MAQIAVVIGAGPGLGASVAARFAREGFTVGVVARKQDTLAPAVERIGAAARAYAADTTDGAAVASLFHGVRADLGPPDVLVYNAGAFQMAGILELSPDDFTRAWNANCLGAFLSAREVLPAMLERGRGTILFTGATASLRG